MKNLNRIGISFIVALMLTASIASASPVGGLASANGLLRGSQRREFQIVLQGREDWSLRAIAEGDGDLDCYIFDDNNMLVGSDDDTTNTCVIDGTPKYTGHFTVRIANNGTDPIAFKVEVR